MLDKVWIDFLRAENIGIVFPRYMGFWSRVKVHNVNEYVDLIKENNGRNPCGVEVYSSYQKKKGIIDEIFVDIDNENGITEEMVELGKKIKKIFSCRVYFSGKKGLHIHLDCIPVRLNNPKRCIRDFVKKWIVDKFNVDVDWAVIGDTSRLCRIVYTKHEKTGNYVIPLNKNDNRERLLRRAKNLFELESLKIEDNAWISKKLLELDNVNIENTVFATKANNKLKLFGEEIVPYCIQKIKNEIEGLGEASHIARLHLASYYILLGYDDNEIVEMFSKAKDFSYDKSLYMVKHIKQRGYWAYSCERLKSMGLCPLGEDEICAFYPSVNLLFRCNNYGGELV
jgi:hypothetical protein